MLDSQGQSFILVYYDIRGKGQVVRTLLCYLEAVFQEVRLDRVGAGEQLPAEQLLLRLRNRPIDRARLPLLVDAETLVYGTFAIVLHLCKRSRRLDLLGRDQRQSARVRTELSKLLEKQVRWNSFLIEFAERCHRKSDRQTKQLVHLTFENVMNNSCFIRETCELLWAHPRRRFVLGTLTVVDFYFWESCFYVLGFFGRLDREYSRSFESFYNSVVASDARGKSNKMYLADIRRFAARMAALPAVRRQKEYLDSFPLLLGSASEQRKAGLRRVWVGSAKFVK